MEKFNVQIWDDAKYPNAHRWDDIPHTQHEALNPAEAAQAIADSTGYAVRLTYPMAGAPNLPVGNLNGAYLHPKLKL